MKTERTIEQLRAHRLEMELDSFTDNVLDSLSDVMGGLAWIAANEPLSCGGDVQFQDMRRKLEDIRFEIDVLRETRSRVSKMSLEELK